MTLGEGGGHWSSQQQKPENNIKAEMSVEETKSSDSLPTSEEYEVLTFKEKDEKA